MTLVTFNSSVRVAKGTLLRLSGWPMKELANVLIEKLDNGHWKFIHQKWPEKSRQDNMLIN